MKMNYPLFMKSEYHQTAGLQIGHLIRLNCVGVFYLVRIKLFIYSNIKQHILYMSNDVIMITATLFKLAFSIVHYCSQLRMSQNKQYNNVANLQESI